MRYVADLFFTTRWYLLMGACAVVFFCAYFFHFLLLPAFIVLAVLGGLTVLDYMLLFMGRGKVSVVRSMAARFSLGDENPVALQVHNGYSFRAFIRLIDEIPVQFQDRNFNRKFQIPHYADRTVTYHLRPVWRGEFSFGDVLCYVKTPFGLLQRRFKTGEPTNIKVYPSYLQLRKHQLMATSEHMVFGVKKVRRLGHSMEFEKIKDYVQGDDVRTINWKASARRGDLMVNTFTDARQQQIYCLIDKGRTMKMPFDDMTLLGYSINASLALLNVALLRQDRAGLITFADKVSDIIPADRRSGQMNLILEALYKQDTDFKESDYESLWQTIHRRVNQRSLLLLFTNFESVSSMQRQLPYLRQLASRHLLCVVFFENTLLKDIHEKQPDSIEGIYIKTIADRFDFEKRQIVKELRRHGILSILTTPQQLSVDVINKYLELKAQQMI